MIGKSFGFVCCDSQRNGAIDANLKLKTMGLNVRQNCLNVSSLTHVMAPAEDRNVPCLT